jgi:glycosyltransferase involved in cell wall biosynthesis
MASTDLFVFPSTTDTLGLVLLEALAAGAPVIAARSAASENALEGLPADRLFEVDDAASLVGAAREVMGTGLSRSELRSAARTRVLDWSGPTDVVEEAYRLAIARRSAR